MKTKFIIIIVFFSQLMNSQTLDPSFGTNGGIINNSYSNTTANIREYCYGAELQSDGKTVFVGRDGADGKSFIARTTTTGSLDTGFSTYGFKMITGNGFENVVIQPDGKILAGGSNSVYRFNEDGSLDNSFNTTGFLNMYIGTSSFICKSMALQNDGKIVLVGAVGVLVNNVPNNDYAAIRLNSDGSFDTTFDLDGKTTIAIGTSADEAFAVAIQSDGKIILSGQVKNATNYDFGTIRLNQDGSLDTSFASNGM
jgi:uncharacterized delta-60 repeat protein